MTGETRGRPITDHTRKGERRRLNYQALRSVHLCTQSASCSEPAARGSPQCEKHKTAANEANRKLYKHRRENDLCRNCGSSVTGSALCWSCSDKRKSYASRQTEYRRDMERGE